MLNRSRWMEIAHESRELTGFYAIVSPPSTSPRLTIKCPEIIPSSAKNEAAILLKLKSQRGTPCENEAFRSLKTEPVTKNHRAAALWRQKVDIGGLEMPFRCEGLALVKPFKNELPTEWNPLPDPRNPSHSMTKLHCQTGGRWPGNRECRRRAFDRGQRLF